MRVTSPPFQRVAAFGKVKGVHTVGAGLQVAVQARGYDALRKGAERKPVRLGE